MFLKKIVQPDALSWVAGELAKLIFTVELGGLDASAMLELQSGYDIVHENVFELDVWEEKHVTHMVRV